MKSSETDIVYVYKKTNSEELKYSIRSVAKNWPHRRIWIVGDKPDWVNDNVCYLRAYSNYNGRYRDVNNKIRLACKNREISDPFWLFNDDFFILKPVDVENYKPTWYGSLEDKKQVLRDRFKTLKTWTYLEGFTYAEKALKMNKCESCKNFENHVPLLVDKKQMANVVKTFPSAVCRRSIYMNIYHPNDGIEEKDVKRYKAFDRIAPTDILVSTDELSFGGTAGNFIKSKFKEKCKYER